MLKICRGEVGDKQRINKDVSHSIFVSTGNTLFSVSTGEIESLKGLRPEALGEPERANSYICLLGCWSCLLNQKNIVSMLYP